MHVFRLTPAALPLFFLLSGCSGNPKPAAVEQPPEAVPALQARLREVAGVLALEVAG